MIGKKTMTSYPNIENVKQTLKNAVVNCSQKTLIHLVTWCDVGPTFQSKIVTLCTDESAEELSPLVTFMLPRLNPKRKTETVFDGISTLTKLC